LTESLRRSGDPTTIAAVIRFIDQMRDITDHVLFRDWLSASPSAGWPQSWMRLPRALAWGLPNRQWCSQFRIRFRRTVSDCSDNPYYR